ncbi:hypothetical protein SAMD00024442_14_16 [Candidatus Symbiothrix dinenymphae]|nr:hypothetical protein SAMD00024442_14_16 [Candidatus Symbiothrix dinenymphae]
MEYRLYNGQNCPRCPKRGGSCIKACGKLDTFDWLGDIDEAQNATDYVEVQFKNTRKGYFLNSNKLELTKGDVVSVEASPGHDIGTVTLTGQLVLLQMQKNRIKPGTEVKRVYRIAKPVDMEKYEEAKAKEQDTMIRSRKIAEHLGLQMKIGDVEYQGDGGKAIFYYIADGRVDFRQLIKDLAVAFGVRIEMKQIGARQEAGHIGGMGPCGRELCCSGWMNHFNSVSTAAARFQDISLNPQKLAGQCAKLKCCFNFEVDAYMEALKQFPPREIPLETMDATYFHFKTDVFKGVMQYSTSKQFVANLETITAERAHEVMRMNKNGQKPYKLNEKKAYGEPPKEYQDILEGSVSRFDRTKKKKNRQSRQDRFPGGRPQAPQRSFTPPAAATPSAATPSAATTPPPASTPPAPPATPARKVLVKKSPNA